MASYRDGQTQHQLNFDISPAYTDQNSTNQQPSQAAAAGLRNGDSSYVPRPKRIACAVCRRRKLRCDGKKPSCGTCSRLGHECTYDEARKKSGPKRGYVKQLEARLAQVETLLKTQEPDNVTVSQPKEHAFPVGLPREPVGAEMHVMGNMDNSISPTEGPTATGPASYTPERMDTANTFGWDMISLGLEEPFPAREVIDELNLIYFDKVHPFLPIIHRPRYMAAMDFAPNSRPPACLQYIVWAHASAVSEKYSNLHALFYQRARKYAELDQMKGLGEGILTLTHCQAWLLIGCYEYKMMFFPRAWLSAGSASRLAVMLGLHRLDGEGLEVKQCLPLPRDWTEKEERRRVFWMAFNVDRYASIGTGWPTCIDERDIMTNLPASEEAFVNGKPEKTARLSDALVGTDLEELSAFASVAFVSCLLGRNLTHLHRPEPQDNDNDLNGIFWQRHRSHDNILLHFALSMPSHLRLPAGIADPNVLFCNLAVHTSTICLHQAAIFKAEKNGMPNQIILESKRRCIVAADQISSIMKMVSSMDMTKMNPFVSFCVYVAARVFVQYLKFRPDDTAARSSLQFVFIVLDALKNHSPLTESFLVQLEVDIEGTPFQDIRLPNGRGKSNDFFSAHTHGEVSTCSLAHEVAREILITDLIHRFRAQNALYSRVLNYSPPVDKAGNCNGLDPATNADSISNRANLPVCLPTRQRGQPPRQQPSTSTSIGASAVPPLSVLNNLPGFSKAPEILHDPTATATTGGIHFDLDLPSRFHDVTNSNSGPESSASSTMNSSSTPPFMRTDRSSSPKRAQSRSSSGALDRPIQDPVATSSGFESTNLNQFIESSNPGTDSNSTINPLLSMGSMNTPGGPDRPQQSTGTTAPWDFPINVNGDPNDLDSGGVDLMGTDLDGFNSAQWAHILGSGGWNP
ncbi:fungal-specific transcription factor domain-containing protein [Aspergillus fruticulosus]